MGSRRKITFIVSSFTVVVLFAALIYPVGSLIFVGLAESVGSNGWFGDQAWHVISFTYSQALLSTVLASILGIVIAVIYADWGMRWIGGVWSLSVLYFVLPPLLIVQGLVASWGGSGFVSRWFGFKLDLYGWNGIVFAHVLMNFPLFLRSTGAALREIGRDAEISALSLGARRWQVWIYITWPKIQSTVVRSAIISFMFCSSSFLIVLILGGRPSFSTIEVAIYQAVRVDYNPNLAAKLALLQLALGLFAFVCVRILPVAVPSAQFIWAPIFAPRSVWLSRFAAVGFWLVVAILLVPPLVGLVASGLKPNLFHIPWRALWGSLSIASLSSVTCLCIATALAMHLRSSSIRPVLEGVLNLPLVISPVLLAFAWMLAYREPFYDLRGSFLLISGIQSVSVLPIAYRLISDGLDRVSPEYLMTARSLGATGSQSFRLLTFPLLTPALLSVLSVVGGFSLGEVGVLLMLMDERMETLPLNIYRLMSQYRFADAGSLSLILLVLVSMLLIVSYKGERWHFR